MRFWKFIKDELNKSDNQEETENNNASEEQNNSDSASGQKEEQNQEENTPNNDSKTEIEPSNQTDDSQSSEEQKSSNPSSQQKPEQNNSDSASEQRNEQNQEENTSNNDSKDIESSNQNNDSQKNEEQKSSNSASQQKPEQNNSDSASGQRDEQNQEENTSNNDSKDIESSNQTNDSQKNEEQKSSNPSSQQKQGQNNSNSASEQKDEQNQEENTPNNDSNDIESSNQTDDSQDNENIRKNAKLTNEQKKELLEKLKNNIEEIRKRKARKLKKEHLNGEKEEVNESKKEKYELSEQTNNFLNQLSELPSFEDRNRNAGYSIDTESYTDIPESIIRTLITKFLNQRFCRHHTDLNVRSNSLEKSKGFYKWEIKDVIVHLQTHQVTKVLTDKYGYEYAQGKNENVPLSFYFDMSGSMSSYTNMLAVIAIELLKKKVKVLIGYNEKVNIQIESIEKNITVSELAEILESAGYWSGWGSSGRDNYKKDPRVKFKYIERNIDNYLIEKKAEKCVIFADFDPKSEIVNLSQVAAVYWFCFESTYDSNDINDFNGFIYQVENIRDLEQGLIKVNEKKFETLCYIDNPEKFQKKVRVKR